MQQVPPTGSEAKLSGTGYDYDAVQDNRNRWRKIISGHPYPNPCLGLPNEQYGRQREESLS